MPDTYLCLLPKLTGLGGPASFTARLTAGLAARDVGVTNDPFDPQVKTILVIGGWKRLDVLLRARQGGKRIVQRLNGMNWLHKKRSTGLKHYLLSQFYNFTMATVRRRLAHYIVYQSNFARDWWHTVYGSIPARDTVIYNAVDLTQFTPQGAEKPPADHYRLLMVEGHLRGGHELGLETGVALLKALNQGEGRRWELAVAGEVPVDLQARYTQEVGSAISWQGIIPRLQIPALDRSAHVLFSADLNAACPNAVIEAMACGLPVVGYATGALTELVQDDAGGTVPWGSNYWNLEPPQVEPLAQIARQVAEEQDRYRPAARTRAEAAFGLERMVDRYVEVLGI
jgi:glycosyltransferase involved in cell wall biosynthesis